MKNLQVWPRYDQANFTVKYVIYLGAFFKRWNMEMNSFAFFSSLKYKTIFILNL